MPTEPLRTVRDRFSESVDRVERDHERVVVTRNGRPAAVLMSPEDLQSLEDTLAILSEAEVVRGIEEGRRAIQSGDFVEGIEAIRAIRPKKV